MRLTRVFVPGPLSARSTITLPEAASEHLVRVLRLGAGAAFTLFDGRGGEYGAELLDAHRRGARARVNDHDPIERESPLAVTLLQSLARGEKMDWVVQKAVELGVSRIVPVHARRSVVQLEKERSRKRVAHWRAVAIGACEQCGRNRVPEIVEPAEFAGACASTQAAARLVLAPESRVSWRAIVSAAADASGGIAILVGPEGGFEPEEIELAIRAGFVAVGLGPRVLRTETAALAALAALQTHAGDLGE